MSRTNRILKRVWLAGGLLLVGFVLFQFWRSSSVHATDIVYDQSGDVVFVECTVVNPTADTVDVVAALNMVSGHQDKTSNPVAYLPIAKSLTLQPKESRKLRFETSLAAKPLALRTQVLVEVVATGE